MNIHYKTDKIAKFYSRNRVQWDHFYPSEQFILEKVFTEHGAIKTVLDAGCACGGLGRALHKQFGIEHYTGVDINPGSIKWARSEQGNYPVPSQFECADIAGSPDVLNGRKFDLVVALGCADWNCDTKQIIKTCWDYTAEGGYFIFSFRLTNLQTLSSLEKSYQYVHFEEAQQLRGNEEKAPYVVTNVRDMLKMIHGFHPQADRLLGYGYWGTPSSMAVIPYKKVVFSVLAARKNKNGSEAMTELLLPLDLFIEGE